MYSVDNLYLQCVWCADHKKKLLKKVYKKKKILCINHGCFIHTELNVGESCANFTDQCIDGTTCDNGTQTCRKYYPEAAIGRLRVEVCSTIVH